jgi:uncharacterized membrane-anchored protein YhcB (DUF1043 family)
MDLGTILTMENEWEWWWCAVLALVYGVLVMAIVLRTLLKSRREVSRK